MKKIINAIKDFLYILTDYGLILTVAVIMLAVLAWRFDILFSRNIEKQAIAIVNDNIQIEIPITNEQENNDNEVPSGEQDEKVPSDNIDNPNNNSVVVATVNIPSGSFPSKIGDILLNSNLIQDKNTFLNRSVEMGLDTKMQSGTFEIIVGTKLDNIIKIIAKTN